MTKEELKSTIANYKELIDLFKENEAELKGEAAFEALRQEIKTIKTVLDEKIANLGITKEQQPPMAATTTAGQPMKAMQEEKAMTDEPPRWKKELWAALLAPEVKTVLESIINDAVANNQKTEDELSLIIQHAARYYAMNIEAKKEDKHFQEAAKAALMDSLKEAKADWKYQSANDKFKVYFKTGAEYTPVELSEPKQWVETKPSGPPTIIYPLAGKALGEGKFHAVNLGGAIKVVLKNSADKAINDKNYTFISNWLGETCYSSFSSTVNARLGKTSMSSIDVDFKELLPSWEPFLLSKVRVSGPKGNIDKESIDLSLINISFNFDLNTIPAIETTLGIKIPDVVASISFSGNLSIAARLTLSVDEKKLLDKVKKNRAQLAQKEIERLKLGESTDKLQKGIDQLKSSDLDDKGKQLLQTKEDELGKLKKQFQKLSSKLEAGHKAVEKLVQKGQSSAFRMASKAIGTTLAKTVAKAIGRCIPGVNILMLALDLWEVGSFVYSWWNQPSSRTEMIQKSIQNMPERMKIFLNLLMDKYKFIPDLGEDADSLEEFLYSLEESQFQMLLDRLKHNKINFKMGEASEGGFDKFLKKMENWSDPEYQLTSIEILEDAIQQTPSAVFKVNLIYLLLPGSAINKGDTIQATMEINVLDEQGKSIRIVPIKKQDHQYQVLEIKANRYLKVQLNREILIFFIGEQKLYINNEGERYWDMEQDQWVSKETYDNAE